MEEKKITLEELDAYMGIASYYVAKEHRLNDEEASVLASLAGDIRNYIFDHVTGKKAFKQEDLDVFFETKKKTDFVMKMLEALIIGGGAAMKTVKVTTKNVVSIIDVDFDNYKDIQRAIGGRFEIVHTERMRGGVWRRGLDHDRG